MGIVHEFLEGFGFNVKPRYHKRYGKKCGHGKGSHCGCPYWKKHKKWKAHGGRHGRKRGGKKTVIIIKT